MEIDGYFTYFFHSRSQPLSFSHSLSLSFVLSFVIAVRPSFISVFQQQNEFIDNGYDYLLFLGKYNTTHACASRCVCINIVFSSLVFIIFYHCILRQMIMVLLKVIHSNNSPIFMLDFA